MSKRRIEKRLCVLSCATKQTDRNKARQKKKNDKMKITITRIRCRHKERRGRRKIVRSKEKTWCCSSLSSAYLCFFFFFSFFFFFVFLFSRFFVAVFFLLLKQTCLTIIWITFMLLHIFFLHKYRWHTKSNNYKYPKYIFCQLSIEKDALFLIAIETFLFVHRVKSIVRLVSWVCLLLRLVFFSIS